MIGSLRGIILQKAPGSLLLEVSGVGYDIHTTLTAFDRLPAEGEEALVYVTESMAMYGGSISLYGFLTLEDKDVFLLLREIPGTGAKKAMDYLDKISKSAPDFRRAVLESDTRALISLFGFTKKTADKIIAALKDRIAGLRVAGKEKWNTTLQPAGFSEALEALINLGYREPQARQALDQLPATLRAEAAAADLIRQALKQLA